MALAVERCKKFSRFLPCDEFGLCRRVQRLYFPRRVSSFAVTGPVFTTAP